MTESYSDKTLKAYSVMMADPKDVFGLGSAAAGSSMCAASMALRAIRVTASEDADMLHAEQDMEKLRVYFLHLIDEENKAKSRLKSCLSRKTPTTPSLRLPIAPPAASSTRYSTCPSASSRLSRP